MSEQPDILLSLVGVAVLTPLTDRGYDWLAENVEWEEWQRVAWGLACDPRCAQEIAEHARADGLTVGEE